MIKKEKIKKEKVPVVEDTSLMGQIVLNTATPPSIDDVIEGPVISIDKGAVYINLAPFGTGIIYGREFMNARDIIKKINVGVS